MSPSATLGGCFLILVQCRRQVVITCPFFFFFSTRWWKLFRPRLGSWRTDLLLVVRFSCVTVWRVAEMMKFTLQRQLNFNIRKLSVRRDAE
ncbi:hypothetical protein BKA81DRAFT_353411 [Phyllosticta paracitricarpa]